MKIIISPDIPNWAFDRTADDIIKYNTEFDFLKIYQRDFNTIKDQANQFDLIFFMSWIGAASYLPLQEKISMTTGIFSHNFEYGNYNMYKLFEEIEGVCTSSKVLFDKISIYKPKLIQYIPPGVDDNIFIPVKKKRRKQFIVGWIGQPTSGGFPPKRPFDVKGYNHILKPLMNIMRGNKDILFKIIDNTYENSISFDKIPTWYNDVDVQICTSIFEGGPFPMFEAASCGIPLISTNVGAISEFITPGENGFIVPSYSCKEDIPKTLDKFKRYILQLKNDRDLAEQMGRNNREKIVKEWSWRTRAKAWKTFFEVIIKNGRKNE